MAGPICFPIKDTDNHLELFLNTGLSAAVSKYELAPVTGGHLAVYDDDYPAGTKRLSVNVGPQVQVKVSDINGALTGDRVAVYQTGANALTLTVGSNTLVGYTVGDDPHVQSDVDTVIIEGV
ncbi:hypothetical protein AGMMS49940_15330 [Spirochaetia bacterium]|nr:hypothetical protein AGMMS49940_15330 [Spirochaetia bacterium]